MAGKLFRVRVPPNLWEKFGTKRFAQRFDNYQAAKAWVKQKEAEIETAHLAAQGERVTGIRSVSISVARARWIQYLKTLRRRERTISTAEWRSLPLVELAGDGSLNEFGLEEWQSYVEVRRANEASEDALMRERQMLWSIARWAQQAGYTVNPQLWRIPKPKPRPTFTRRFDPVALESALELLTPRDRLIVELAAGTGMRAGELRAARVEWVRWDAQLIEIPHSEEYSPKGGRARRLPLSNQVVKLLEEYVGELKSGPLIRPIAKDPATKAFSTRRLLERLRKVGYQVHGMHDLRHHYLSMLASRGVPGRTLQELAGHKSLRTTDLYLHAAPSYLEDARRALEVGTEVGTGDKRPKKRTKKNRPGSAS